MKLSSLRGVGVALVTPFKKEGTIDFDALEKLIEHVIEGGVSNLVSLGTTGESATISLQERKEIVQFTIEKAASRVPVIVGIGGNNTQEVVKSLKSFPLDQAEAVLSVSPYYNKPSAEGLYQHYKRLAEASPKPIVLYNVPGRTGRNIPVSVVLRLARDFENIVGVKDASDNIMQCMEIIREKPEDFTVVSGSDDFIMPQISCGMEGAISVMANIYPKEMTSMVEAALENDFETARKYHYELLPAYDYLFIENNPSGIKAFLAEAGMIEEYFHLPLVPASLVLKDKIRQFMKKHQSWTIN